MSILSTIVQYVYTYTYIYIYRMISNTWFLWFWWWSHDGIQTCQVSWGFEPKTWVMSLVFCGKKGLFDLEKIHQFLHESNQSLILNWLYCQMISMSFLYVLPQKNANGSSSGRLVVHPRLAGQSLSFRKEGKQPWLTHPCLHWSTRFRWVPRAEKTRLKAKICRLVMKCPYLWLNKGGERYKFGRMDSGRKAF